jgi:hypothetical protein
MLVSVGAGGVTVGAALRAGARGDGRRERGEREIVAIRHLAPFSI